MSLVTEVRPSCPSSPVSQFCNEIGRVRNNESSGNESWRREMESLFSSNNRRRWWDVESVKDAGENVQCEDRENFEACSSLWEDIYSSASWKGSVDSVSQCTFAFLSVSCSWQNQTKIQGRNKSQAEVAKAERRKTEEEKHSHKQKFGLWNPQSL